jgi:hypothetical protein
MGVAFSLADIGHGLACGSLCGFVAGFHLGDGIGDDGADGGGESPVLGFQFGLFLFDPLRQVGRQGDGDSRELFVVAHTSSVIPDMKNASGYEKIFSPAEPLFIGVSSFFLHGVNTPLDFFLNYFLPHWYDRSYQYAPCRQSMSEQP